VVKFRCCREVGGLNFEVREDLAESFHHGATEGSKVTQRIDMLSLAKLRVFVTPWLNSVAAGKLEV